MNATLSKKLQTDFLKLLLLMLPTVPAYAHVYLGGTLGASFASLSHQTPEITYDNATVTDTYPQHTHQATAPILSLNGGYEFSGTGKKPAIALGLGVYTNLANYDFNGQLIETLADEPSVLLSNYTYNIYSTRLLAEVQLNWAFKLLSPFLHAGIGPVWNRMSDYKETAASHNVYTVFPPFQSQTNVNLAYQFGGGLYHAFNFSKTTSMVKHERFALGYRYANLGTTSFGTRGSAYPYPLNTGTLQTNDVYLSYTHLI